MNTGLWKVVAAGMPAVTGAPRGMTACGHMSPDAEICHGRRKGQCHRTLTFGEGGREVKPAGAGWKNQEDLLGTRMLLCLCVARCPAVSQEPVHDAALLVNGSTECRKTFSQLLTSFAQIVRVSRVTFICTCLRTLTSVCSVASLALASWSK